jgi:hypothetical protein
MKKKPLPCQRFGPFLRIVWSEVGVEAAVSIKCPLGWGSGSKEKEVVGTGVAGGRDLMSYMEEGSGMNRKIHGSVKNVARVGQPAGFISSLHIAFSRVQP